ncbi:MAG: IPT/TIG domain-containing protein [Deltaproteobacteria bacterium]|nr:IPT/TIG domain-containing protein [Deltaproteobacteria bacterium]
MKSNPSAAVRLRTDCSLALFLVAASVTGCRDEGISSGVDAADAGPLLPDARVIDRIDGGPRDGEVAVEPTLNGVLPRSGSELGGTRVVLRGTAFADPLTVRFGGVEATSVLLLDEVSIAATTPPGPIGRVSVSVTTPGGEATLPNAFTYVRDLQLIDVDPADLPEVGGARVKVVGRGFDDHTIVLLDRKPLRGMIVTGPETIEGFVPALRPGRPEVIVLNRDARVSRSDLVRVYATPQVLSVEPSFGPDSGGTTVFVQGSGFEGLELAELGGVVDRELRLRSGSTLELTSPALSEGTHAIRLANAFAEHTHPDAFVALSPSGPAPALVGVVPSKLPTVGGSISIVGRGLESATSVRAAGQLASLDRVTPNLVLATFRSLPLGPASLEVGVSGSTLSASFQVFQALELTTVTPTSGASLGGSVVTIRGRGFTSETEVRIADVPLTDLTIVSSEELTGKIQGGAYGAADVTAVGPSGRARLGGAFWFEEAFEIIQLWPDEGSMAGNTLVTAFGRGLSGAASITFAGQAVSAEIENGSVASARAPRAEPSVVDVSLAFARSGEKLDQAYTYYDPRVVYGGGWGGPVEGSVNVGVMSYERMPVPGVVVQLGFDADPRYSAVTDENGVATISWPELRGPQTVTVGRTGFEHATFAEVDNRNLSFFVSPYPASPPPDAPNPPCPEPGEPPLVRGHLYKFKSAIDTTTRPGWIPIALITYSQPSVFQPNPALPPEQIDYVFADGGEYEIVVVRGGPVAVYALMGDYNQETMEFIPRRLGIRRQVPAVAGEVVEGADVELTIELDRHLSIRLDQPPTILPGPTGNAIFPFVNLGSEGVIPLPFEQSESGQAVEFENLPNAAGLDMLYMGGSYTLRGTQFTYPYSITLASSDDETAASVDIGPFLDLPRDVSPKPARILEHGRLSWVIPGTQPDVTTILVVDSVTISGCCCADLNQNGACEDSEPLNCGGAPQDFNRWSIFGPGDLMSYPMPQMPAGVRAFEDGIPYFYIVQHGLAPRFDWREFNYLNFSANFWRSWSVWYSQFLAKEATLPVP